MRYGCGYRGVSCWLLTNAHTDTRSKRFSGSVMATGKHTSAGVVDDGRGTVCRRINLEDVHGVAS